MRGARSQSPRLAEAAVVAALVVGLAPDAPAQDAEDPVFRVLVESGDAVSGRANAFVAPLLSRDVIALDRSGRAFFDASLRDLGGSVTAFDALLVSDGTTVRAVIAAGDPAPALGVDTGGAAIAFIDDDEVAYSPSGDVLAKVELRDGTAVGPALLTEFDGVARLAVARGVGFGGVCGVSRIGNGIATRQFAVNGDALVFHAIRHADLCGDSLAAVHRSFGGGAVGLIALEGGGVPGRASERLDGLFSGPALNEDGTYVFTGRYRDDDTGDVVSVLLRADPEGGLVPLASSHTAVPTTGLVQTGFATWTIGRVARDDADPRVAWVANAAAAPDEPGQTREHVVFDTAHGGDPILRTGTVFEGFTFDAVAADFARTIAIAVANDDTLIAVGDTLGPGIPAGGEAVWRYDTRFEPPLRVIVHEGGPVPGDDPRASGRTISRIHTVNLNEAGRLAIECELAPGGQAILLEETGTFRAGRFRIPVLLRDTLPTRSGSGEVFGLLSQLPSFPRVTGTGEDGFSSRFNPRGEFVFRARIDPDDGGADLTSLYTVSLDRPPEPCDVEVRQSGGDLSLRSRRGHCDVTVRSSGLGDFDVVPGQDTTLNGEARALEFTGVTGSLAIALGGGNDRLILESSELSCDRSSVADVERNVVIDTGDGFDTLRIDEFEILGSLTLVTGSGGRERLEVSDVCVGGNLKLLAGRHAGDFDLAGCVVEGVTKLVLPGIPPEQGVPPPVDLRTCSFGRTTVRGSPFPDDLSFDDCDFVGTVKIDTRGGVLDDVRLSACDFEGAVRITAKRTGRLTSRITDTTVVGGGLRIQTGTNGCDVLLLRTEIDRDLEFRTRTPTQAASLNVIHVRNCLAESFVTLKGKGSTDFALGDGTTVALGVSLNTKGGILDQISVTKTDLEGGSLVVKSRAGGLRALFSELTVQDGALLVRGTKGSDRVTVRSTDVTGLLQIAVSKGDDEVALNGVTVLRDLRLFGGSGNDLLDQGGTTSNGVSGETIEDSFEGVLPPDLE